MEDALYLIDRVDRLPMITLFLFRNDTDDNDDSKFVRAINIRGSKARSYDEFIKRIDEISNGDLTGSDAIDENKYYISLQYFNLMFYDIVGNKFDKANKFLFCDVEDTEADGCCLFNSLSKATKIDEKYRDAYTLSELETYLNNNNICVYVYADFPKFTNSYYFKKNEEFITHEGHEYKQMHADTLKFINKYGNKNNTDDKTIYINLCNKNNHFVHIKDMKTSLKLDNIFIDDVGVLYRKKITITEDKKTNIKTETIEFKKLMSRTNIREYEGVKESMNIVYVDFDFEAVFKISTLEIIPYSIVYSIVYKNNPNHKEIKFLFGHDCAKRFINDLYDNQANKKYVLKGFNNSNFDNWQIVKEIAAHDWLDDVFYNKNQILNIKFGQRHETFDIYKFLPAMSLAKASTAMACKYKKIGGFSHSIIQKAYIENNNLNKYFHNSDCKYYNSINNKDLDITLSFNDSDIKTENKELYIKKQLFDDYINDDLICKCNKFNDLFKYNMFDVLSCEELYRKIEDIYNDNNMLNDYNNELFKVKTIGSGIYHKFISDLSKDQIIMLELDDYKRVRKYLVAGRTQCYKNMLNGKNVIFYDLSGKNKYKMIDVVSLYPYVMLNRKYPCGKLIKIDASDEKGNEILFNGKMGIYTNRTLRDLSHDTSFLE